LGGKGKKAQNTLNQLKEIRPVLQKGDQGGGKLFCQPAMRGGKAPVHKRLRGRTGLFSGKSGKAQSEGEQGAQNQIDGAL